MVCLLCFLSLLLKLSHPEVSLVGEDRMRRRWLDSIEASECSSHFSVDCSGHLARLHLTYSETSGNCFTQCSVLGNGTVGHLVYVGSKDEVNGVVAANDEELMVQLNGASLDLSSTRPLVCPKFNLMSQGFATNVVKVLKVNDLLLVISIEPDLTACTVQCERLLVVQLLRNVSSHVALAAVRRTNDPNALDTGRRLGWRSIELEDVKCLLNLRQLEKRAVTTIYHLLVAALLGQLLKHLSVQAALVACVPRRCTMHARFMTRRAAVLLATISPSLLITAAAYFQVRCGQRLLKCR